MMFIDAELLKTQLQALRRDTGHHSHPSGRNPVGVSEQLAQVALDAVGGGAAGPGDLNVIGCELIWHRSTSLNMDFMSCRGIQRHSGRSSAPGGRWP